MDIKVLFMSGYTGDILIDKGILQPGDSVITKPVLASELRERVQDALDGARVNMETFPTCSL
jgi:CheY-like chemotaxis protein